MQYVSMWFQTQPVCLWWKHHLVFLFPSFISCCYLLFTVTICWLVLQRAETSHFAISHWSTQDLARVFQVFVRKTLDYPFMLHESMADSNSQRHSIIKAATLKDEIQQSLFNFIKIDQEQIGGGVLRFFSPVVAMWLYCLSSGRKVELSPAERQQRKLSKHKHLLSMKDAFLKRETRTWS